ncbi:MAG TPA: SDR family oxidoreductase [Enhygromyxa sp.]|nr:SDR family oxidoreductase [Enhygromyxa sp.]
MSRNRFAEKVIVIPGSTSGVGKTAALAFAREGGRLVLSGRRKQRGEDAAHEITQAGGEAIFVQGDLANPDDVERLFKTTLDHYGRIDCAFNNHCEHENGVALTADLEEQHFDRHIQVGLKGLWLCMKHEIKAMLKQGPGNYAIVNSSSISGVGGGWPFISIYSVVKSGVAAFTKSAAQEYAQAGIRCNCLGGGFFDTEMIHRYFDELAGFLSVPREQLDAMILRDIPLGRMAREDEIANTVLFLCSRESSYITGASIIVDGGMASRYL